MDHPDLSWWTQREKLKSFSTDTQHVSLAVLNLCIEKNSL